jgi:predicted enzyme related to lactoylglutathione lyase
MPQLTTIVLDCADPAPLAEFYREVTGWEVTYSDADSAYLGNGGAIQLAFYKVEGYQPPDWPSPAKQAHLDFQVDDLDVAVKQVLALGATKPEFQPGGDRWTVLADPQGHLLCLVA